MFKLGLNIGNLYQKGLGQQSKIFISLSFFLDKLLGTSNPIINFTLSNLLTVVTLLETHCF
jgi:hypothetical protein